MMGEELLGMLRGGGASKEVKPVQSWLGETGEIQGGDLPDVKPLVGLFV